MAEVALPQRGKERAFEPVVQLLETREGERLVRFAYRTEGQVRRGPVTVRVQDLARARKALERGAGAAEGARGRARDGQRRGDQVVPTGAGRAAARERGSGLRRARRALARRGDEPGEDGDPPVGPSSGSTACSGCGIMPTTLPAAFRTPATPPREPFTSSA